MTDIFDRASDIEEMHREQSITAARKTNEPPQYIENGIVYCIDCGEDIPAGRLNVKPNAARCVACQGFQDLKDRC